MKINILFIIFSSCLSVFTYSQQDDNRILATVGNHNITLLEFNERYTNYLFSTGAKDNLVVRKAILENIINELLLYYYDSNENILNDSKYLKELEETGVRTILAFLKDREIYAKITANEEEIREA